MIISFDDFIQRLIDTPSLMGVSRISFNLSSDSLNNSQVFLENLILLCRKYIGDNSIQTPAQFTKFIQFTQLTQEDIDQNLELLLSTSFLGTKSFYFYTNYITDTKQKEYLDSYTGPNCLIYISDQINQLDRLTQLRQLSESEQTDKFAKPAKVDKLNQNDQIYSDKKNISNKSIKNNELLSDKSLSVIIPEFVNKELYAKLYLYFFNSKSDTNFLNYIFKFNSNILLDNAISLMRYQYLLYAPEEQNNKIYNNIYTDFFNLWYSKNFEQNNQLFKLSELLLSKDYKNFFATWQKYKLVQPIEFWISFWSNQIFNASYFVKIAISKGILEAKKSSSKLPFSFINKHWKLHKFQSLIESHTALYNFDTNNKLGFLTLDSLDLWFNLFLLK